VSLRFRLNLLITLSFVIMLIAGTALIIQNARSSVAEETQSTAQLTLRLLQVAFNNIPPGIDPLQQILIHLAQFEKTRHLHIDFESPTGGLDVGLPQAQLHHESGAPDWFVRMVEPPPLQLERTVLRTGGDVTRIIITADPADEIREAWRTARTLLGLLLILCLLSNGMVYVFLGRALKPIDGILRAIESVERGNFHARLPDTGLPELDVIARKFNLMAGALERSREQNRLLTQKSLAIQEQERRYLAQELHDELGQSISAIKALAVSILQAGGEPRRANDSARTITEVSQRIYDTVRGLMSRLRPVILDELGLLPALQNLVDEWNEHHGDAFCRLEAPAELPPLKEEVKINLYRIVQEALTNVAKHARAGEVAVTLNPGTAQDHGMLELQIKDNGIGMTGTAAGGLGLRGMRERAEALGGTFELVSASAGGVCVRVKIPIAGGTA